MKVNILYEDDDLLVVDKAAGVLTIGDRFNFNTPSILSTLRKRYGEVYTVHRLDKETSGIVIFARNSTAHKNLSQQFEDRSVTKTYIAFVEGETDEAGEIDEPIAESPFVPGKMVVHKKGKPSLTRYRRLGFYQNISEVEIDLLTGRTHQIRVHFAYIGHPLYIDETYGRRTEFFLSELLGRKYHVGKHKTERPLISRLTLHAARLTVNHPADGKSLHFESELPKDMRALKYQLEKSSHG